MTVTARPRTLRLLFVVPPLTGHLHPALALAAELSRRGHRVAWAGPEPVLRPVLGPGALVLPTGSRLFREQAAGGAAAIRSLWRDFVVPYTRFTLPAVRRAVAEWRPDLVLADQHSPAGALAAQREGVAWAGFAPSSMELGRPPLADPELVHWQEELLHDLWRRAGLDEAGYTDPRFSPRLILAATAPELLGVLPPGAREPAMTAGEPLPAQCVAVGPLLTDRPNRPAAADFPWDRLREDRRRVLVTMGTLSATVAEDFLLRTAKALDGAADRVQAVVAAPPSVLERLPDGVLGLPEVPVLELLRRGAVEAVLCHGGMNTVCEALAYGVPLVLAPIRHDQPITAARVGALGAGVVVDFATAEPRGIREALLTVLDDPGPRAAARRIADRFTALGGAPRAADLLEECAG
ncbi:glycosyltransferase [Actinacidiphila sp. ITFR-21]|uniref:glycosyltransferase n=1 Tax=Actinacidiphila sp. ITFR-21 TaxID=3075199 RepID=UPI00288B64B7|nr:glycosyltransferase [Streptomyces sp. ITFR-21]WNI19422.1 glycosyltransferase [Streptomyces sp. ITFR-21]